jgi:hypothetical protein
VRFNLKWDCIAGGSSPSPNASPSMAGSRGVPVAVDSAGATLTVSVHTHVSSRPSSLGSVVSSARREAVEEAEAAASRGDGCAATHNKRGR